MSEKGSFHKGISFEIERKNNEPFPQMALIFAKALNAFDPKPVDIKFDSSNLKLSIIYTSPNSKNEFETALLAEEIQTRIIQPSLKQASKGFTERASIVIKKVIFF